MFKICIVVLLFAVTISQIVVTTDPSTVTATFGNATVELKLVGVPRYTVISKDGTSSRIMFSKLYQIDTQQNFKSKLAATNVALASLDWSFSAFYLSPNQTYLEFNMTGTPKNDVWSIIFRNKVRVDKVQVKFDTMIRSFNGAWSKDANFLVMAYKYVLDT
jgi:hypothetical protein